MEIEDKVGEQVTRRIVILVSENEYRKYREMCRREYSTLSGTGRRLICMDLERYFGTRKSW